MPPSPIPVGVNGACGRMGSQILRFLSEDRAFRVTCALEAPSHPCIGKDAGVCAGAAALGVPVTTGWEAPPRLLVDFSTPESTLQRLEACERAGVAMVVGTTGLDEAARKQMVIASRRIPIFLSQNMSLGIGILRQFLPRLAAALGPDVDVEIVETHHRMKKDAPSGTALDLARQIAKAIEASESDFRHGREGMVGVRKPKEIGIHAVRAGDVPGEHLVTLAISGERVEVAHRATSRECFARGAVRAARFLSEKGPGLYDMDDLLGKV